MFSAKCRRDFAAYTKQAWYEAEQRSSYGGNGLVKKWRAPVRLRRGMSFEARASWEYRQGEVSQ